MAAARGKKAPYQEWVLMYHGGLNARSVEGGRLIAVWPASNDFRAMLLDRPGQESERLFHFSRISLRIRYRV
jgi:hypothetical protein